jgi:hypothetical protein
MGYPNPDKPEQKPWNRQGAKVAKVNLADLEFKRKSP